MNPNKYPKGKEIEKIKFGSPNEEFILGIVIGVDVAIFILDIIFLIYGIIYAIN